MSVLRITPVSICAVHYAQLYSSVGEEELSGLDTAPIRWIVDDAAGNKVAQFTQDHNGVRRAILEFEGETQLPATDIAALAWVSREVLETKKMINSTVLIAFLVFLSIFVVVVFLIQ